jgi:transporter family-2 protein
MSSNVWLLIPLAFGVAQPVLWLMNQAVARAVGHMESALVLHVVGTVVGMAWLSVGLRGQGGWTELSALPWWVFLAGALGVTGMAGMNRAIPEVGVAACLAALVASQFGFAVLCEHYGWMGSEVRPATLGKCLGAVMLAVGAWLVSR